MKSKTAKKILGALKFVLLLPLRYLAFALYLNLFAWFAAPLILILFQIAPRPAIVMLTILVFAWLCHRLRRLLKRRRFLKDLKRECREAACDLQLTGHPYLNVLLGVRAGARLMFNKQTVALYFIACRHRLTPTVLKPEGSAVYHHRIRLARVTLFTWQHIWHFCEEPAPGSYLVLLPAARKMYLQRWREDCLADNGDRVGNYRIYTGGAFLRHMERTVAARGDISYFGD